MHSGRIALSLIFACTLVADTLELRDGRIVKGTYLGGNSRQVRMEVGGQIETYNIQDTRQISFEGPSAASSTAL